MGFDIQLSSDSGGNDGFGKSLDRRSRNVFFFLSGDFECLALKKSLDLRYGKSISVNSSIPCLSRLIGLDFALVSQKWPI